MKKIIAVERAVAVNEPSSALKSSPLLAKAMRPVPSAPTAAPSVGVNSPP